MKKGARFLPTPDGKSFLVVWLPPRIRSLGKVLLHGFSRGSANVYGVTALDRHRGGKYFLVTIANAGKAGTDFPINREIGQGRFGPNPFQNSHWILYGGGRDPHPERDGIPGMRETADHSLWYLIPKVLQNLRDQVP